MDDIDLGLEIKYCLGISWEKYGRLRYMFDHFFDDHRKRWRKKKMGPEFRFDTKGKLK